MSTLLILIRMLLYSRSVHVRCTHWSHWSYWTYCIIRVFTLEGHLYAAYPVAEWITIHLQEFASFFSSPLRMCYDCLINAHLLLSYQQALWSDYVSLITCCSDNTLRPKFSSSYGPFFPKKLVWPELKNNWSRTNIFRGPKFPSQYFLNGWLIWPLFSLGFC